MNDGRAEGKRHKDIETIRATYSRYEWKLNLVILEIEPHFPSFEYVETSSAFRRGYYLPKHSFMKKKKRLHVQTAHMYRLNYRGRSLQSKLATLNSLAV